MSCISVALTRVGKTEVELTRVGSGIRFTASLVCGVSEGVAYLLDANGLWLQDSEEYFLVEKS